MVSWSGELIANISSQNAKLKLELISRYDASADSANLDNRIKNTELNNILQQYPSNKPLINFYNVIKHLLSDRRYPRHALCGVRVSDDFPLALRLQRHQLHHHHHGHHHRVRHPPVRLEQTGAWRVSHSNQLHQVGRQINNQNRNDQI